MKKNINRGITLNKKEIENLKNFKTQIRENFKGILLNSEKNIKDIINELENDFMKIIYEAEIEYKEEAGKILMLKKIDTAKDLNKYITSLQIILGLKDTLSKSCDYYNNMPKDFLVLSDKVINKIIETTSISDLERIIDEAKNYLKKEGKRTNNKIEVFYYLSINRLKEETLNIINEIEKECLKNFCLVNSHLAEITTDEELQNLSLVIIDKFVPINIVEEIESFTKVVQIKADVVKKIELNPQNYNSEEELKNALEISMKEIKNSINSNTGLSVKNFRYENNENSIAKIKFSNGQVKIISKESETNINKDYTYKELNKLAIENGFKYARCVGDHATYVYRNEGKARSVTIPQKASIGKGLQVKIIKKIKYNQYV